VDPRNCDLTVERDIQVLSKVRGRDEVVQLLVSFGRSAGSVLAAAEAGSSTADNCSRALYPQGSFPGGLPPWSLSWSGDCPVKTGGKPEHMAIANTQTDTYFPLICGASSFWCDWSASATRLPSLELTVRQGFPYRGHAKSAPRAAIGLYRNFPCA